MVSNLHITSAENRMDQAEQDTEGNLKAEADFSQGGVAFKDGAGDISSSSNGEAENQISASGMGSNTEVAGVEAEVAQASRKAGTLGRGLLTPHFQRAQSSCQTLEPPLEPSLPKDCHTWYISSPTNLSALLHTPDAWLMSSGTRLV